MTDQLDKWKSQFGDDYVDRNMPDDKNILQREALFTQILFNIGNNLPKTILEVGAGVGNNLAALSNLYHNINREVQFTAIEPNEKAKEILKNAQNTKIIENQAFYIEASNYEFDLVFTCGVLIHLQPDHLLKAMQEMYRTSNRYILCIEYFAPKCEEIKYHNEENLLWRNDFGGIWLDNFPLRCINYGFTWKRVSGLDNLTWWLFEKVN